MDHRGFGWLVTQKKLIQTEVSTKVEVLSQQNLESVALFWDKEESRSCEYLKETVTKNGDSETCK